MPMGLVQLQREVGLQLASHVWTTTVASQTLIAAPSAGKAITLHYLTYHQSAAAGLVHIAANTTAGTTYWTYNGATPNEELALIKLGDAEGAYLHMAATGGAGYIRAYYSIRKTTGT